ncbi:hypothetical protein MP228_001688 [Amoeboaphelidium protococcarum]|nr:hypothetical protein MP228_001688 [Amoeboaphelidium protococcarum]
MAWYCSAASNSKLVENLVKVGVVRDERVVQAMKQTDRAFYAPHLPYQDSPQYIGHGATISAPHMHAHALQAVSEYLRRENCNVLDVGSGSGYLSACFARVIGPTGHVVGIDHVPSLVDQSIENVRRDDATLIESGRLQLIAGDGRKGYPQGGPYDVIHVGAACQDENSLQNLQNQLKQPGVLFVPVEDKTGDQTVILYEKKADAVMTKRPLFAVRYVPLTSLRKQTREE